MTVLRLWCFFIFLVTGVFAQELHLKVPGKMVAAPSGRQHLLLQFDHPLNPQDLAAITQGGGRVVAAVPDNSVMILAPDGFIVPAGVQASGVMPVAQKISAGLSLEAWNGAVVEFHDDVSAAVQDSVGAAEGFAFLRLARLKASHVLAFGTYQELTALAAHDEVAYVFPADMNLLSDATMRPCVGMLTQAGAVAQYSNIVHGWDLGSDQIAHLNYFWADLTLKVPALQVQSEILRALNEWAKHTNITFQQAASAAQTHTITILFAAGAHGDPFAFDGPGGVLAHTFYPVPVNPEPVAGDMHFDAAENWHIGGDIDIYSVALHEAGHALGLGHSDNPGDVMYPYYRSGAQLSTNDIGAVQQLYGSPVAVTGTPPVPVLSIEPLTLSLNPLPATTAKPATTLSGAISGGQMPVSLSWQTDHGNSGAMPGAVAGQWTVTGIPLVAGTNTITVNAMDAAHNSATVSIPAVYQVPAPVQQPTVPPPTAAPISVKIQSPAGNTISTSASTISLAGIASGGSGNLAVNWQSSIGLSGVASGSNAWSAPSLPLYTGTNTFVVRATDSTGASAWTTLVVTRK